MDHYHTEFDETLLAILSTDFETLAGRRAGLQKDTQQHMRLGYRKLVDKTGYQPSESPVRLKQLQALAPKK